MTQLGELTFYPDKQAYKFAMCANGCVYAAVEGGKLCKRCLKEANDN